MDVNVYKLKDKRKQFVDYITNNVGMERIGEQVMFEFVKEINGTEYRAELNATFYFDKKPAKNEIVWFNYWSDTFSIDDSKHRKSESIYGIILIELNKSLYVISMGLGYHSANQSSVNDFGFEIAERIINPDEITMKSVKFYKQTKNRSITQYYGTFAINEVGESNELLVGKLEIDWSFNDWVLRNYSEDAVFGTSVKISAKKFRPKEIFELIFELDLILEYFDKKYNFPRLNLIPSNEKNQKLKQSLDKKLMHDLITEGNDYTSLSFFRENDGNILVIPLHSMVELIYNRVSEETTYSIESIRDTIRQIEDENIDVNKVSIKAEEMGDRLVPIKRLLDYTTEHKKTHYCLHQGRWATFNQSYIEFISNEINHINSIVEYKSIYNLDDTILEKGEKIINKNPENYDAKSTYAEYKYNVYLAKKYNFELWDREDTDEVFNNAEAADLYNVDNKEIIHVKIGEVSQWRYCIKQSLQSLQIIYSNEEELSKREFPKIENVTLLLLTPTRNIFEKNNVNLNLNKSIYFKTELVEWYNEANRLKFTPRIIFAKDLREKNN